METKMAAADIILSKKFDETESYNDNKPSSRKTKALSIVILVFICIALMINNASYILYIPLVVIEYAIVSNNESLYYYGILYASKDIALLLAAPFAGAIIDRVGYEDPMIFGMSFMILSSIISAFGGSYWVFFANRIFQGLSSAFTDVSIMVVTAILFTGDRARINAFGMLLGGTSLGFVLASPFVVTLTEYLLENRIYFLVFDPMVVVNGLILFFLMKCLQNVQRIAEKRETKTNVIPMWRFCLDPYIMICAGALCMSQAVLSFLVYVMPFWLGGYMAMIRSVRMTSFLAFFSHILGIIFTLLMVKKSPERLWIVAAGGLVLEGLCGLVLPFASSYVLLLAPTCGIAFGIALVRTVVLPTLAKLADSHQVLKYGTVYAIAYVSYAIVDIVAPISLYYKLIPYTALTALFVGVAILNILYAPLLYFLKRIYS